jgi:ankyrin repeat protein
MYLSPEQIRFLDAAERGDVETINATLAAGVDVNIPDPRSLPKNRTALMHAARGGHLEVVEVLLDAGANPDDKDKGMGPSLPGGNTALLLALENKHLHVAKKLLAAGANPDATSRGLTVLGQAAALGDVALVRQVLKTGVDPNVVPNRKADLPLVNALFAGHTEVVRALLSGGADPDLPRKRGRQPLELAIQEGLAEAVQLLLHRGAERDRAFASGMTPLMTAAHDGQKSIVKILLKHDAVVNARNKRGWTALDFAQRRLDPQTGNDLSRFLQRWNLDQPGYLALFHEIVALLREAGARAAAEVPRGRTPERKKTVPSQTSRPTSLKKNSGPKKGLHDLLEMVRYVEPEYSVIAVKASLDKTAAAFAEFCRIKKWTPDVPCHDLAKPGRANASVIAFVRIKRNSWTIILRSVFCLADGGEELAVEEAKELSTRLRTNALVLVRNATEETTAYDFFGRGRRWEHARWTEHASSSRFSTRFRRKPARGESPEDFVDAVFRQQRIYVPAAHPRSKGKRTGLEVAKSSAPAIQRADIMVLARVAGKV